MPEGSLKQVELEEGGEVAHLFGDSITETIVLSADGDTAWTGCKDSTIIQVQISHSTHVLLCVYVCMVWMHPAGIFSSLAVCVYAGVIPHANIQRPLTYSHARVRVPTAANAQWNLDDPYIPQPFKGHSRSIDSINVSPDGYKCFTLSADCPTQLMVGTCMKQYLIFIRVHT